MERMWNPVVETLDGEAIQTLQTERLRDTLRRVYDNVPFYRDRLDAMGAKPEDFRSIQDLQRFPYTVKDDLRDHYPYGLFATPMRDVVRVHASSGTTGRPTVVGYTRADLDMWSEVMSRLVVAAGGSADDIAHVAFGYGLFTGAFGLHYALEKVGATVIPVSSGNTERQIQLMRDFGATLLISTPSYALYLAEVAERMGVMKDLKLRIGLFGAEGSTNEMRDELERRFHILATENYGLSEIIGPGVSGECVAKCGMHINEDHFLCEIIDPDTGALLPDGAWGELVITTLTKQALPLIRYRTHDITRLHREPCACGRHSARMEKVRGRSDDMLIIRGVNVFPSQIESVLIGIQGIGPHYEINVSKKGYLDQLEVVVEMTDERYLERFSELEALQNLVRHKLRITLQIDAAVRLVSPQSLKRFEGKAKRVNDTRNAEGDK